VVASNDTDIWATEATIFDCKLQNVSLKGKGSPESYWGYRNSM